MPDSEVGGYRQSLAVSVMASRCHPRGPLSERDDDIELEREIMFIM